MAVTLKVEPIDRDVQLIISQDLSPAARSRLFAADARSFIAEADEVNRQILGRIPPRTIYVDGAKGASLESVRPDGVIIAEWELVSDVLVWIAEELERRSPRFTGRYGRSHTLFADGTEVDIGGEIPIADRYVFLNTQPYARKIEGASGREPESQQAPDGVYQVTARAASARFGNIAKISFTYEAPASGAIVEYARSARRQSHRRGGNEARRQLWLTSVPAIVVRLTGR